jgi:hypothetical protein
MKTTTTTTTRRPTMTPDRLTLAEYARATQAHYSTLYDRVRASERRGGHGIQTRDEFGELKRQYRKDWQRLCKPIPRGRPKKEVER